MKIKTGIIGIISIALLLSCNKEKRYSSKLQKGEVWRVRTVNVDGLGKPFFGTWKITSDVAIYDAVPKLTWEHDSLDAVMEWQFQDKGKNIQLNYYQLCEECDATYLDTLDYLSYAITGKYKVERHGRNKMRFTSTNTLGYSGKEVMISIERKP